MSNVQVVIGILCVLLFFMYYSRNLEPSCNFEWTGLGCSELAGPDVRKRGGNRHYIATLDEERGRF